MRRKKLIADLRAYAVRYPGEQGLTRRFLDFVTGHERCFERDCLPGHVTGSAWIVSPHGGRALLTHHKKLGRWLQPGGHSDGEPNSLLVALREASEESGLELRPYSADPIDIDIHDIPATRTEPAHRHYDLRYALGALSEDYAVSDESHALAWVRFEELEAYTSEASVLRLRAKWRSLRPPLALNRRTPNEYLVEPEEVA